MILRTIACMLTLTATLLAQTAAPADKVIHHHATGSFVPNVKPVPPDFTIAPNLGRMTIAKEIHGGLEGKGSGQMLTGMTAKEGSAAYVAVELIDGTLEGHKGTFLLVHKGIMDRGQATLTVTVVPDSGTGELTGITGTFTIHIATDGKHTYDFDYTLPAKP